MRHREGALLASAWFLAVSLVGCDALPGRPRESDRPLRPSQVRDFARLYDQSCSGCHGAGGRFGAALPLDHPVYLALVDDQTLRRVIASGVARTSMPAFAKSAGGSLTDEQIDILISGMRKRWGRAGVLRGASPPPYGSDAVGDAHRGEAAYALFCQSCHGADGTGGPKVGSIVAGSYLALVSDQALRTLIIAGRPDLEHPDWRSDAPGQSLTSQQVSDVVAWLAAKRPELAGPTYPQDRGGALPR